MKLVQVIPIARGINMDILSYFTKADIPKGSVVLAPLRNKEVSSIVIGTDEVQDVKTKIRTGQYSIKKVSGKTAKKIFLPQFIEAAERIAEYYATTTGAVLFSIIPKAILLDTNAVKQIPKEEIVPNCVQIEKLLFQAGREERIEQYKNIAREEFAKNKSVFIMTPTIQDALHIEERLQRGIEAYTFALHSKLSKKEIVSRWNKALTSKHPVLIIGTGQFLSLPRRDIQTIVVEKEQTRVYKSMQRPFIDMRIAAEMIASSLGARLIFADIPLRIDSIHRYKKGEVDELSPLRVRTQFSVTTELVDMRKKEFKAIGKSAQREIRNTLLQNGNVFVFAARRGLSPITVCQDCGNTVVCEVTGAPVVLHKGKEENVFVCHASGTVRSAHERCVHCKSWKLQTLGIGVELVEKELQSLFQNTPLCIVSRDTTTTHAKTKKVIDKFYETPGSILVGTEMVLPYLTQGIETSIITSVDSLLSIPDWNVYEKIFSIILQIQDVTTHNLLLQTRKPEQYILTNALRGNISDFYRDELKAREQFGYPPYAKLIKISIEGGPSVVESSMKQIEEALPLSGKSHLIHLGRNRYAMHGFLRLNSWPDKDIIEKLKALPPTTAVNVDPPNIL